MKKYAIIVAGGSGQRMQSATPKQFLNLLGRPVICYTVDTFLNAFTDITVVLVVPATHIDDVRTFFNEAQRQRMIITAGGHTRFHSVQNGLAHVLEESIVFVHDGVRCLASPNLIRSCYTQAVEKGSAVPFVYATDSIRILNNNSHQIVNRKQVAIIQTPQVFKSIIICSAFAQPYNDSFTDEASVVEAHGKEVFLIEGEYENIKITRPVDLLIAEMILKERR